MFFLRKEVKSLVHFCSRKDNVLATFLQKHPALSWPLFSSYNLLCVCKNMGRGNPKSFGRHYHDNPPPHPQPWKQQENHSSKTCRFASTLRACSLSFLCSFIFSFTLPCLACPVVQERLGWGGGYSVHSICWAQRDGFVGKLRAQAPNQASVKCHRSTCSVKQGHYLTARTSEGPARTELSSPVQSSYYSASTQSRLDEHSLVVFLLLLRGYSFAKIRI